MTKLLLKAIFWLIRNKKPLVIDVNYMNRWFIIPRNRFFNIYFHESIGSDAPTMHDHPWWSIGLILKGQYIEHTPSGDRLKTAGNITLRRPKDLHWIEIDKPVYTLCITGPRVRRWGFQCSDRWVDFEEYLDTRGPDRLASGCGDAEGQLKHYKFTISSLDSEGFKSSLERSKLTTKGPTP